jgi:hypothetical protein
VGGSAWRTYTINYNNITKTEESGTGGERGRFSSTGPTRMGLTKPDVLAPGMNIISSMSSYYL